MFNLLNISGSGMNAHKTMLEITANNIANMETTRTEDGGPYRRQAVSFKEIKEFENILQKETGKGVEVGEVIQDDAVRVIYDPQHPDANGEGYVMLPEINMPAEMGNLLKAQRGYESNVTTLNASKKMVEKTLEIGR